MAIAALAEPYRMKRLTSFLDPWADPFNDGFQLAQALIAIGRGEWFGVGLGASMQKLFYLPEAHTDFILAVIAEELGLVGVVLVLALFALLVARAFAIGAARGRARLPFAGYFAFGDRAVDRRAGAGVDRREPRRAADQGPDAAADQLGRLEPADDVRRDRRAAARSSWRLTRREAELALTPLDAEGAGMSARPS